MPEPNAANVPQNSGSPLPETVRPSLEASLGADLSNVRVHTDVNATAAARSIGVSAFTQGDHIYISTGMYNPGSPETERLLAHELAHVVQQREGRVQQ